MSTSANGNQAIAPSANGNQAIATSANGYQAEQQPGNLDTKAELTATARFPRHHALGSGRHYSTPLATAVAVRSCRRQFEYGHRVIQHHHDVIRRDQGPPKQV